MNRAIKNNMISFWRIIFTYAIVIFHLNNQYHVTTSWAISVEFFFIVSGWLLSEDLRGRNQEPYGYLLHRIKRLYPQYITAFLVSAIFFLTEKKYNVKESLYWIGNNGIRELLMIHYWPWGADNRGLMANTVTWYISVMLVSGLLIYSMGKRIPKLFSEVIAPSVIICFFSYMYRTYGNLFEDDWIGAIGHVRFYRGFAEMSLGYLLNQFSNCYSEYIKNKIVQLSGFCCLVFVITASFFYGGSFDFLYVLLISYGVFISFNTPILFGKKIIAFFDGLSYSLYLNHIIFRSYIIPHYFQQLSVIAVISYLCLVTLFAMLMAVTSNCLMKASSKLFRGFFTKAV